MFQSLNSYFRVKKNNGVLLSQVILNIAFHEQTMQLGAQICIYKGFWSLMIIYRA